MNVEGAGQALVDPVAYADGRLERACRVLRDQAPIHLVEHDQFRPFHAVTRHADIQTIERDADRFQAGPRYRLFRKSQEDASGGVGVRSLVRMDPPDHTAYRALAADWFIPKNLRVMEERAATFAKDAVDLMAEQTGAFDFVSTVSMWMPLRIICAMLGISDDDGEYILRQTQINFGAEDPDYVATAAANLGDGPDWFEWLGQLAPDRRAHPTDDLTSAIANARLDGEPLPDLETISYFAILATAGHDTTAAVLAGGVEALARFPDQLSRLEAQPELLNSAVEEMLRWTTPVKSFMRTATQDTELQGNPVRQGDALLLLYPSGNRDELAFDNPENFDVGRTPNRHLAFGHGAHFCLGAQLARIELRAFFRELIPRLRDIELAGDPALISTLFVGGHKYLPLNVVVD
ncbi:cytochrome P450 [Ilumatobacter nonamiensis]|uniref:cytochrome P450 n=1 Tax=Ilumatobacter nonamiensis TaxID=467093 RepID=UPI00058E29C6|nr:cytochrome P450 [Ilumatobacter nonamiensis]